MSFRIRAALVIAVMLLFFGVELFGQVQDEGDEALHVWFLP